MALGIILRAVRIPRNDSVILCWLHIDEAERFSQGVEEVR